MTATITESDIDLQASDYPLELDETGNADMAHVVLSPEHLRDRITAQAYLMHARLHGLPVQALCGRVFVPSRDATALPPCQECVDLYEHHLARDEHDRSLPDQ